MTNEQNEQKAIEFATSYDGKIISFAHLAALHMGAWKDEQFAKEKQQWIERACKYISCHQCEYIDFDDFKKAMEE